MQLCGVCSGDTPSFQACVSPGTTAASDNPGHVAARKMPAVNREWIPNLEQATAISPITGNLLPRPAHGTRRRDAEPGRRPAPRGRPGPYSCSLHRPGPRHSAAEGLLTGSGGFRLKEQGESAQRAWRARAAGPACLWSHEVTTDRGQLRERGPSTDVPTSPVPVTTWPEGSAVGGTMEGGGAGEGESPPRRKVRACLSETPPAGGLKTRASRLRAELGRGR